MAVAKDGIDIRVTDETMVFTCSLKMPTGALLTSGTTNVYLLELQDDGTVKTYDWSDNTFKSTAPTTKKTTATHRQADNDTLDTGLWTVALSTLTGFTVGGRYIVLIDNTNAAERFVARQFVYGALASTIDLGRTVPVYLEKKAEQCVIYIGLYDASTEDLLDSPTIATGDFRISKDGGALQDLATIPAVTPAGSGMVKITLSATEMNASNVNVRWTDQTAPDEWKSGMLTIVTSDVDIDDLVRAATPVNELAVDASGRAGINLNEVTTPTTSKTLTNIVVPTVSNVTQVDGFDADVITPAAIADNAIGSDQLAASAVQKIWDALTSALTTSGSIGKKLVDDLDDILAQLGSFSGADQNTIKEYLLAIALATAGTPTDFSGFTAAEDALTAIGDKTNEIGTVASGTLASLLGNVDTTLTAAVDDTRLAIIDLTVDDANSKDEYTVHLLENGKVAESGWAGVKIQAVKRSDGTDLIAETAMTKIGPHNDLWMYDATGVERITAGEAIAVVISGTKDGEAFKFKNVKARDSSS